MGYRVGTQCLNSSELAHDYIMSQVSPTITTDGQLIRPIKNGQHWYLNEQLIQLSFPDCDISTQIQFGAITAAPLIGLFVIIFGFRMTKKMIESMSTGEGRNDD